MIYRENGWKVYRQIKQIQHRSGRTERISRFTNCLTEMINRRGFGFQPPLAWDSNVDQMSSLFWIAAGREAFFPRRSEVIKTVGIVRNRENLRVIYGNWDAVQMTLRWFFRIKNKYMKCAINHRSRTIVYYTYRGEMSRPPTALFSRRRFSICLLFFYYCKKTFLIFISAMCIQMKINRPICIFISFYCMRIILWKKMQ